MREIQLIALGTIIAVFLGSGLFLVTDGDGIPGLGSSYVPGFRTLDSGSGPTDILVERKNYIFRDDQDYRAFWELVHGTQPGSRIPPIVSFTRNDVIAIVSGVQTTGGYSIRVDEIRETPEERIVEIVRMMPEENCIVTQALTNPYHMVVVQKTSKPLRAVEIEEVIACE